MANLQFGYDALRIRGFDRQTLSAIGAAMVFLRELAHAGRPVQGRYVAKRS